MEVRRPGALLARRTRRGWRLMIFCTRATRGLRRPSLDARSGRSISPHPWRDNERAWKDGIGSRQTILLARRTRTMKLYSFDARSEGQSGDSLVGRRQNQVYIMKTCETCISSFR
jgi:hypothetical protein